MNFNYHAVSKKDRIKKTLLFGIPATLIVGVLGGFVISIAEAIGFNILYYAAVLGIGYITGTLTRKIGRGTTYEFLIIAGVFGFVASMLSIYMSFIFQGIPIPLDVFFKIMFDLTNVASGNSIVEVVMSALVSVYLANTVQL